MLRIVPERISSERSAMVGDSVQVTRSFEYSRMAMTLSALRACWKVNSQ